MSLTPGRQQAARDVLGFEGHPEGWTPGGFTSALLGAFLKADSQNTAKLASVYPDLAWACYEARSRGLASLVLALKDESP